MHSVGVIKGLASGVQQGAVVKPVGMKARNEPEQPSRGDPGEQAGGDPQPPLQSQPFAPVGVLLIAAYQAVNEMQEVEKKMRRDNQHQPAP